MYRRPPLPDLKPPHAFGGHTFVHIFFNNPNTDLLQCVGCYGILAAYELREGFMANVIGPWCPDALIALEEPAVKHVCEYCKGTVMAAPRVMDRTVEIHLDSCPAALRNGRKPKPVEPPPKRKRIIPRQVL